MIGNKRLIVFFLLYVSDVSYGFFKSLHDLSGEKIKVICTMNQPLDKKSNRKLYYNEFIINYHSSHSESVFYLANADIIIFGNMPTSLAKKYNKTATLVRISERKYKKEISTRCYLHDFFSVVKNCYSFNRNKKWLFAIGGYTYGDYLFFGAFRNRSLKFAYLGEYDTNVSKSVLLKKHKASKKEILWMGSMDYNKHLDKLLQCLCMIENNKKYHLTIIGDGLLKNELINLSYKLGLSNNCSFVGNKSIEECKQYMKLANIYVASGGREEGYNCSILMAYNYLTVVIANEACGSTIDLVNASTGYSFNNFDELRTIFECLFDAKNEKAILDKVQEAWNVLSSSWNSNVAAERFSTITDCILNNQNSPYEDGIFSKSKPIINVTKRLKSE